MAPQPANTKTLLGHLIVEERSGTWAEALRRAGVESGSGLRETRSLGECAAELQRAPASMLVVEATRFGVWTICEQIFAWETQFPHARAVVALAPDLRRWEPLLRECGAVHVASSPRRLAELVALTARHWRQYPQRIDSPEERIWASLPWSR